MHTVHENQLQVDYRIMKYYEMQNNAIFMTLGKGKSS